MSSAHRPSPVWLESRRRELREWAALERDRLLDKWCRWKGLRSRPFPSQVIDDIIRDVLDCELREEVLPSEYFGQTDFSGSRPVVKVNSRLRLDKRWANADVEGILAVSKGHEAIHVLRRHDALLNPVGAEQLPFVLPGLEREVVVSCSDSFSPDIMPTAHRTAEFEARAAAPTFMIPGWALTGLEEFDALIQACRRAEPPPQKTLWAYIYSMARDLGVNPTFVKDFLVERRVIGVEGLAPKQTIVLNAALDFDFETW